MAKKAKTMSYTFIERYYLKKWCAINIDILIASGCQSPIWISRHTSRDVKCQDELGLKSNFCFWWYIRKKLAKSFKIYGWNYWYRLSLHSLSRRNTARWYLSFLFSQSNLVKKIQTKFQSLCYSILAKVGIQIESNITYP